MLQRPPTDYKIHVYGSGSDQIEIEGDIYDEFDLHNQEHGDLLAFSNGLLLGVVLNSDRVWRISVIAVPWLSREVLIEQAPEDDTDNYTDHAYIFDHVDWVLHGVGVGRTAASALLH